MVYKIRNIKHYFPFFRENKAICYLDFAATTFMPDSVMNAWYSYQTEFGIAAGRIRSWLGHRAAENLKAAREEIKNFFGAGDDFELIFSKNATEALNITAWGTKSFIHPGDMIVVTSLEHHSNYLPWRRLANERSALLVELPIMDSGDLDINMLSQLSGQCVKLVCTTYISNVTGAVTDLEKLIQFARQEGALVIVDATQAAAHSQIELQKMDVDCLVVSAHKMYGPKNIGGLLLKRRLMDIFEPLILGGGMVRIAGGSKDVWTNGPEKFEGGTHDPGLALAWAQSCRFLTNIGWVEIKEDEERLASQLRNGLNAINNITILSAGKHWSPAITSFILPGIHSHDLENYLGKKNIIIRTGHLCAQTVLQQWGLNSVNRVSMGLGATSLDVEKFLKALVAYQKEAAKYGE